jgi:hypothetical protein
MAALIATAQQYCVDVRKTLVAVAVKWKITYVGLRLYSRFRSGWVHPAERTLFGHLGTAQLVGELSGL